MTGARRLRPRVCGWPIGSPRLRPPWTGWRKRGLPHDLRRVQRLIAHGLLATAPLWPPIRTAYRWLHHAAHLLNNTAEDDGLLVRRAYRRLLGEMHQQCAAVGPLAPATRHFLKVTRSYWPGLFVCYTRPDIPRTNNDLEQCFASVRYHERRVSGRKAAAPMFLVRGSVRLLTATSHEHLLTSAELRPTNLATWRALRQELSHRHTIQRLQRRFRRDPVAYLAAAERLLLPESLPP